MELTIDGRAITVEPDTTILEAALAHGIDIPRLCWHPDLSPSGGCRLCIVEIDGQRNPQPSCGMACQDEMIVRTHSDQLHRMRRDIIDLFVSDHPLDCVVCDKNGACDLQKYAYRYGIRETSFDFELSRTMFQDDNPFFIRDHQYCILCGRCTRVCEEVIGADAIKYVGRGFDSHIGTPFDGPMIDSSCVFCGSCVQVCPTAALMPRSRLGKGREWELERKRTVCGYCGVGCEIEFALQDSRPVPKILYAQGYQDATVNGEFLCVKGRYGWDFADSPERLTQPLMRRDLAYELGLTDEPWEMPERTVLRTRGAEEHYIPVTWDQALDVVADRLAETVRDHGSDAVAGLASARCTNEENYVFQKLMRATIGTNNVDHCARLCHASTVTGLVAAFGSGAMTNSIRGIRDADCIFITGSNTAESHPVIGYEVVRAAKQGANVIICDPRRIPLVDHATLFLQAQPGTDIYVFLAMMHVILREGWADEAFIRERTEGFEEFAASVEEITPEVAALKSGVPVEKIEVAARMYALGERDSGPSIYGDERGHSSILYAMGITQRSIGTDLVKSLANLALLCGQVGKPSTGVNPLRGQANVQGACDLGALPNVLPGYQAVSDDDKRRAVAQGWDIDELPAVPGLTVVEMMHAVEDGRVRAMYIMGENPMLSDPNIGHVERALRRIDFLVVQDIFLSETAQLAHVVLPAAASLEKDGTFTNTERRVQLLQPVLPAPGESRTDWDIVSDLARRLDDRLYRDGLVLEARPELVEGHDVEDGVNGRPYWGFASTAEIMEELARVTPIYGGMRHHRLSDGGLVWPCPTTDHPGTPILHVDRFARGRGKFHPVRAQMPAEEADDEYPFTLTTGRVLYHYHTGTMTRRSEPLNWREPRGFVEVNEQDAEILGIKDGGPVTVRSRRGEIRAQARVGDRVGRGVVFIPFHFKEAPANLLTQDHTLDPVAKIPEYKVCAVQVENPAAGRR